METKLKLDEFTRAYIECALWSSSDESDESGGEPMDANYTIDDIAPESLSQIVEDCSEFQKSVGHLWEFCESPRPSEWDIDNQAGHDFWLTRNGHGTGFWDRDCYIEIDEERDGRKVDHRNRLTAESKKYPEVNLYVGDDGQVHCA